MLIIFFLVYLMIIFSICFVNLYPQIKAKRKYGKDEFLFLGKLKFIGGLNLPQNVMCNIICLKNQVVMTSNGQEFILPVEKLVNVSVMTNTEIQKQYVSSIGGAVAGSVFLGPLGAILGGTPYQKKIKTKMKYLIFSYHGEEEIKYIIFDATKNALIANKFRRRFNGINNQENIKVNL